MPNNCISRVSSKIQSLPKLMELSLKGNKKLPVHFQRWTQDAKSTSDLVKSIVTANRRRAATLQAVYEWILCSKSDWIKIDPDSTRVISKLVLASINQGIWDLIGSEVQEKKIRVME